MLEVLWEVGRYVLGTGCAVLAATFLIGTIKIFMEGPDSIAKFDRAGITFGALLSGRIPDSNATRPFNFTSSAEIEIGKDGKIWARPLGSPSRGES